MIKRFIEWIYTKITIEAINRKTVIEEGRVYWCSLGENIGFEQDGKGEYFRRPVLIFKKFNNNIFWGIPMSTVCKNNRYYVEVLLKNVKQSAIVSQLRLLDTKRLDTFIGYVSKEDFMKIKNTILEIIQN